jgi:polar amino acid transport system substrate-binding protein
MKKLIIPAVVATAALLTSCSSGNYAETKLPAEPAAAPTTSTTAPAPKGCKDGKDALASYAPDASTPALGAAMPAGSFMA